MDSYRDVVERIRMGDRNAFDELTRRFWHPVLGYFRRRLPRAASDELTQTVFVNVYRTVKRGGGENLRDRESWSQYLFGVARNVFRDHRDHRRHRVGADTSLEDLYPEEVNWANRIEDPQPRVDTLESAETRAALEACLDELDVPGRRLTWSHFVDGQSKRELARALNRPESSVRVDVARVLARLRSCVEGKGITVQ